VRERLEEDVYPLVILQPRGDDDRRRAIERHRHGCGERGQIEAVLDHAHIGMPRPHRRPARPVGDNGACIAPERAARAVLERGGVAQRARRFGQHPRHAARERDRPCDKVHLRQPRLYHRWPEQGHRARSLERKARAVVGRIDGKHIDARLCKGLRIARRHARDHRHRAAAPDELRHEPPHLSFRAAEEEGGNAMEDANLGRGRTHQAIRLVRADRSTEASEVDTAQRNNQKSASAGAI